MFQLCVLLFLSLAVSLSSGQDVTLSESWLCHQCVISYVILVLTTKKYPETKTVTYFVYASVTSMVHDS
jgi:hypothetical protein